MMHKNTQISDYLFILRASISQGVGHQHFLLADAFGSSWSQALGRSSVNNHSHETFYSVLFRFKKMAGAANNVSETDHSLAIQCMDLTKHLANQDKSFIFSLSLQSGFTFSLDVTQEQLSPSSVERKKPSPSTLKRNAVKKKNIFYGKEFGKTGWVPAKWNLDLT